jgi:hypothetical protein
MESLGQKQRRFARRSTALFDYLLSCGYEFTWGETKRSDEQAEINALGYEGRSRLATMIRPAFTLLSEKIINNGKANGIRNSAHQNQLAVDINLFKDGIYLPNTEDHRLFGEWWEKLGEDHRWGGRWGDGNHYSIEHNGVK